MESETEKIIREQMEKLPAEIRDLFIDSKIDNKIINIGTKHSLNVEQMGNLQTEIYLVMLGLVHPDEFPEELKISLQINEEEVDEIIKDINFNILDVIREKLKKVYESTNGDKQEDDETDDKILSSAGIDIMDGSISKKPEITQKEKPIEKVVLSVPEKLEIKEAPPGIAPPVDKEISKPETATILAQKMSSSLKGENIRTEYSLNNLSKAKGDIEDSAVEIKKPQTSYPPNSDPYRLSPDQ